MADFIGTVPTRYGLELLGLLGTGVTLNFTRAAVGSGVWNQEQVDSPAEMEALVNEAMSLAISPESVKPVSIPKGDEPVGMYEVSVFLTNAGLQDGFALREIGIFADHPTRGEILFAVDYAGDRSDYIPALPANAAPLEKIFKMAVLTGLAKEITVNQSPVLLATHDDIGDHNTNPEAHPDLLGRLATGTPEILFPLDGAENIGETPIYRFRQFAPVFEGTSEEAIQVQIDLETGTFANPVHDSGFLTTIAAGYEQPAGMLQAGKTKYKIRYRRRLNTGQISEWSEVFIFETRNVFNYVARPVNVSPSNGATGVMECPKLISGPFAVVGDAVDIHEATQYRMRIGDTVLHLSPELGAVVEYDFPAGLLLVSGDYVWEVRYKGAALGWSEWSIATSFHTAAAFIIGDEAISFTSWDGYDNASAAGVALADDAALRSNGVDQGAEEGDWASFKLRGKIRGGADIDLKPDTSATELVSSTELIAGKRVAINGGKIVTLGNVTDVTVNNWDQVVAIQPPDWSAEWTGRRIVCNPAAGTELYAVGHYQSNIFDVRKSIDDGQTWTICKTFSTKVLGACVTDLGHLAVLTVGHVYISYDRGETFELKSSNAVFSDTYPAPRPYRSLVASADAKYIFVIAEGRLYWSNNYGVAFSQPSISAGCREGFITSTGRYIVYKASAGTIAYTDDYGETWLETASTGMSVSEAWGFVEHKPSGKIFFCAYASNIYESSDNGKTWTLFYNNTEDESQNYTGIFNLLLVGDHIYATNTTGDTVGLVKINVYTKGFEGVNTGQRYYGMAYNGSVIVMSETDDGGGYNWITDTIYTASVTAPLFKSDISAAGLIEAPSRAKFIPKLTAATGPAGTAFTAADFNEIPVANATLGTDTDTDRPDFILLESEKITPATPFRRVAIGASDLQKDSETRISETQCDTWKQGA
ncbi:hypothetical protein [Maridesulfovibrio salexigens]|uniref:Uncharacterized protein n=1 Tax=Maridesulfovibrio salexigens (strain ATCC 14822 / DSM 2638 / NCIMB 8403 / VKM B-1763) TaxID=526222 RepID=C6BVX6_MARSD|nr:hypothetical protein [Maridesulfovibrio salexigens]ACS80179.1 hypothetical protein Desal_2119 [Maridesulfovibrio salexigens DSM 2638]